MSQFAGGAADKLAVEIEAPYDAVIESLQQLGFSVDSINPRQLDRFRDRLAPSGYKDDRCNALMLANSLRTDAHS